MAPQRRRTRRDASTDVRVPVRLPPALKADLQDAAERHGISMNEEINRRLRRPRKEHMPMDPTTFRALMALEDIASDPSVPVAEVVRRMEEINPYRGLTDQLMDGTQAR